MFLPNSTGPVVGNSQCVIEGRNDGNLPWRRGVDYLKAMADVTADDHVFS